MSVRQMGFLCRPLCITALVALSWSCGSGGASGPTGPQTTEPEPDAAAPGVPKPSPDAGAVTPPATQPDAASPGPDQGSTPLPPPPMGGAEVVVEAGMLDRQNTIVTFPFPAGAGKSYVLAGQGAELPVQLHESGNAVFVLPSLKAGTSASFRLQEVTAPPAALSAAREADGVVLAMGQTRIFRYQTTGKLPGGVGNNYLRGGYIHPMFTPGGLQVTDDYPGDHRHHHGIWSAWAHTHFEGREMDFWNMGGGSAKVDFESLASSWDGPVHAGFHARHLHTDLRGNKTALKEDWLVTVYRVTGTPAYFVFDLDSTQEAASASPVNLDQYIYGGFAFRGSPQWRAGANFLTSEGKDRGSGDGTTARWCYIGGRVDGKMAGYAVLGHPTNFRAPQPMRINPSDPFFSYAPVRPSGFTIMMGKPYVTRFRVIVTDGEPDKALYDRQWSDYADPPKVTLKSN